MHSTRFQRLHRRFGAALMPSRIAFLAVLLYLISLIPIFLFSSYCHPLADDFTYGLLVHRAVVSGGGWSRASWQPWSGPWTSRRRSFPSAAG